MEKVSEWLPERHYSVASSLSHVDELAEALCDLIFCYQTLNGEVIKLREERSEKSLNVVVDKIKPIPVKVPLLAADILVNLRGALEHTIFAEVLWRENTVLEEKALKLIEMPNSSTYEKFQTWTNSRKKNGPTALKAGSILNKRIERLQPFQRNVHPEHHPLARLIGYTNLVKHRMPAVTAINLPAMHRDDVPVSKTRNISPSPKQPLNEGSVIASVPTGQRVPFTLFPSLGINRPRTDEWPLLVNELKEITSWVRFQALPILIVGDAADKAPLPARIDIRSSACIDQSLIDNGTQVSAFKTYQQRLATATARVDLAEMLKLYKISSSVQAENWIASQPDEKIDELWTKFERLQDIADEAQRVSETGSFLMSVFPRT